MSKFSRTIGLLGEGNFNNIQNKTIFIAGLGGVGGTAFISLLRTGFRKFIIADFDSVDETNLNRQVIYTSADIGKMKTNVAKHYALSINDAAEIITVSKKINQESLNELKKFNIDFIIDCIDDISGKVDLVRFANEHNIPIVENKPLARSLYKMVEVDRVIPVELYTAVAEVLAYVYNKNKDGVR